MFSSGPDIHATEAAERFCFGLALVWCCGLKDPTDDFPISVSCLYLPFFSHLQGLQFICPQPLCLETQSIHNKETRRFLLQNPNQHGNTGIHLQDFLNDPEKKRTPQSGNSLSAASDAHLVFLTRGCRVLQTPAVCLTFFLLVELFWFSSVITIISKYLLLGLLIYLLTQNLLSTFLIKEF